jgi:hypothetical protein
MADGGAGKGSIEGRGGGSAHSGKLQAGNGFHAAVTRVGRAPDHHSFSLSLLGIVVSSLAALDRGVILPWFQCSVHYHHAENTLLMHTLNSCTPSGRLPGVCKPLQDSLRGLKEWCNSRNLHLHYQLLW